MLKRTLAAALAVSVAGGAALAEEHTVQMLNRGSDGEMMVFEPAFLKIEPGDTVTFVPTDKAHNAESILGAVPEGAEAFKGKINQEISVTFDEEGVHAYKCLPHFALGMIGLVQVGDGAGNLDELQAVKLPGKAAQRMALLVAEVEAGADGGGNASD